MCYRVEFYLVEEKQWGILQYYSERSMAEKYLNKYGNPDYLRIVEISGKAVQ